MFVNHTVRRNQNKNKKSVRLSTHHLKITLKLKVKGILISITYEIGTNDPQVHIWYGKFNKMVRNNSTEKTITQNSQREYVFMCYKFVYRINTERKNKKWSLKTTNIKYVKGSINNQKRSRYLESG